MEQEKKQNTGLIVLVIILCLMVLGLGGYIVYDRVLNSKEVPIVNDNSSDKIENTNLENSEETNIEENNTIASNTEEKKDDSTFLPERCSYEMMPYLEALFIRTVEYNNGIAHFDFTKYNAKDETLIKAFLNSYLILSAIKNGSGAVIGENGFASGYSLNIDKSMLDSITKIVFNTSGLKDYTYLYRGQLGLSKINDNYYKLSWAATGGSRVHLYDISIYSKDGKNYITTSAKMGSDSGNVNNMGKAKITISMNNDYSCYIEKIEKID